MQAGKLRHRITIEQSDGNTGTGGEEQPNWSTFATLWASIESLSGSESLQGKQMASEISHRVTTRYCAGVTADMRIKFGARVFSIVPPINHDERNIQLEFTCIERTTP